MKNFEFDYKGKKYWYSRGIVCVMFLFVPDKDGNLHVLANERGDGVSDSDMWNCPCGHLDFDESCEDCAVRETFEETGIQINKKDLKLYTINSTDFKSKDQSVSFIYYAYLPDKHIEEMQTTTDNMEENEVNEIKWIDVDEINNYTWAFGHDNRIKQILSYIVNNEK